MRSALRVCNLTLGLALLVVLLGAWTRLNDAGLGCPDWPGCYGHWVLPSDEQGLLNAQAYYPGQPLDSGKGWLEMVHRYAAASLGMMIVVMTLWAWRSERIRGYPLRLLVVLTVLVIVQGVFGMLTVTLKLLPQVVTLHLLGGLLTLTLLLLLRQALIASRSGPAASTGLRRAVQIGLMMLFVQIALGGWTSANYAGWACTGWPQCNPLEATHYDFKEGFSLSAPSGVSHEGGNKPQEARAAIQMVHRTGAWVVSAYLGVICWYGMRSAHLRRPALGVATVLVLQSISGIANVLLGLPLWLAMIHHAGVVLLLVCLLWLYASVGVRTREVAYAGQ